MSVLHSSSAELFAERFFSKLSSLIQSHGLHCKETGIAVAYSGGLDSTVLLALTSLYARQEQIPIFSYHVNHGISPFAQDWQDHCREFSLSHAISYRAETVCVQNQGQGVESTARKERYQALGRMCDADQVSLLLVAHHLDDQAETMLMQLFRGTGVRGLTGMDECNLAPGLLNLPNVYIGRPLLSESRSVIQDFALTHQLAHIEDESNSDLHYTRNAVRHLLMPQIDSIFPHFSERLLRTSNHVRSAQRLLDELAANDLIECERDDALDLRSLSKLSSDRISNVFRYWLTRHHVQLPSTSKIAEIQLQLFEARDDARVAIRHGEFSICRYASKIYLLDHRLVGTLQNEIEYCWNGEGSQYFPELKGTLYFQRNEVGIAESMLKCKKLTIRFRCGGERLKLAKNRPTRDLKSHFQTARIPFWQRESLPIIYIDERLFFVGLLGMDAAFLSECTADNALSDPKIQLTWVPLGQDLDIVAQK